MYKLIKNDFDGVETIVSIQRLSDGAFIPLSPGNRDYDEYLVWLEAGNTPLEDSDGD